MGNTDYPVAWYFDRALAVRTATSVHHRSASIFELKKFLVVMVALLPFRHQRHVMKSFLAVNRFFDFIPTNNRKRWHRFFSKTKRYDKKYNHLRRIVESVENIIGNVCQFSGPDGTKKVCNRNFGGVSGK